MAELDQNPIVHCLTLGWREHHTHHPLFDSEFHATQLDTDDDPLRHHVVEGSHIGLDTHPLFSSDYYLAHGPCRRHRRRIDVGPSPRRAARRGEGAAGPRRALSVRRTCAVQPDRRGGRLGRPRGQHRMGAPALVTMDSRSTRVIADAESGDLDLLAVELPVARLPDHPDGQILLDPTAALATILGERA